MFFSRSGKASTDANSAEEAKLVALAQSNPANFALLYERYFERIYRYCYRRLGQAQEAEDITSLVFTRALAGLANYRGGSAAAWLFQIAHNAVANQLRSRRPELSLEVVADAGELDKLVARETLPLERLVQIEDWQLVASLIAKLPTEQRELLALSVAGGLSAKEVGQVLGKSEGAIWVALHRIVKRLNKAYKAAQQEETGKL